MTKLGERLKELRLERNLKQREVCEATKISKSSFSRWENNQADIFGEDLIKLALYFHVTTDFLLGLTDY